MADKKQKSKQPQALTLSDAWASLTSAEAESFDEGLAIMEPKTRALVKYMLEVAPYAELMEHDDECIQNCTVEHSKCRSAHGCWCSEF